MLLSFTRRLLKFDVFISFALSGDGRSTRAYAADLARRLRERDLAVFFSEDEMRGDELAPMLANGLRRSRTLVVIANRGTLAEPRVVRQEVEQFRQLYPEGRVLPVSIDRALRPDPADADGIRIANTAESWLRFRHRVWIDEPAADPEPQRCGDAVVEDIVRTVGGMRTNVVWRWLLGSVFAVLVALTVVAGWQAWLATRAERDMLAQLQRAVAMRLVMEARLGLEGSSSERWTTSLRKLLVARALGAAPEADAVLGGQLQAHPPTLDKIWDVGEALSDFELGEAGDPIVMAAGRRELWLADEHNDARKVAVGEKFPASRRLVRCLDEPDCLVVASHGGAIHRVTGLRQGKPEVLRYGDTGSIVTSMILGADGRIAITADGGLTFASKSRLAAWDLPAQKLLWHVADDVTALAMCAGAERGIFASGGSSGVVTIRRVLDGSEVSELNAENSRPVTALAFTPDCNRLLAAYGDDDRQHIGSQPSISHDIALWALDEQAAPTKWLIGHGAAVTDIAVSHDGLYAASGSRDGEVRLWDMKHGMAMAMPLAARGATYTDPSAQEQPLRGHRDAVVRVKFDATDRRLYSAGADGLLVAWHMQVPDDGLRPWAADIAAVFKNAGRSLAISAKHDMLLVGREDGHISEFSLSRGTPRDDWPQGKGGSVIRIEVEPSERWAVLVSRDTDDILHLHYEVRDLTTRRVVGKPWSRKEAHPHAALFLANGALRLGCDENGEVETRDLPEGNGRAWGPWKDLAAPPADLTPARLQALCPAKSDNSWEPRRHVFSENWVVQPSYQAAAELRQLGGADTGWHPVGPSSNNEKTQLFGFSRDGRVLASASSGGEVRLWNPADGRMIDAPRRFVHGTPVSLAITPGAERVAVLSSGVVQVFVTAFHDGRSICRWFPEPVTPAQWTAWVGDRIAFRPTCGEDLVR